MPLIEDQQTLAPFIKKLEEWGCQVLQAINRPNPYRGGFTIIFRCEDEVARAIADLGLVNILVDVRANTYQLRLPEINFKYDGKPQPELVDWTEETKRERLNEILHLWENTKDILDKRNSRLRLFYSSEE